MDRQMPADRREPRRRGEPLLYAIALAEVVHVVKAHAAEAELVELLQLHGRRRWRRQRYAAVVLVSGEQVGRSRVVEAMRRGLHDDAALDAQVLMQREQRFFRRVAGRRIAALRREGKSLVRAEDVEVRIAGAARQLELRLARLRVE